MCIWFLEGCPANHAALLPAWLPRQAQKAGTAGTFGCCRGLIAVSVGLLPRKQIVTSFLDPVIAFVSAHPWLAYLTLFLAALLEAVPVVGALVPGSTIILALSALVPGGELKLWGVLAAAVAGAVLGDGSAFWAGHRSQREILGAWPMSRYPAVTACSTGVRPSNSGETRSTPLAISSSSRSLKP